MRKVVVNTTPIIAFQECGADLLIIDDNAAKKTAKYLNLTVTGTMGVLLKAKKEGVRWIRRY